MFRLGSFAVVLVLSVIAAACVQSDPDPVDPGLAIARIDEVVLGGAIYSVTHELYLVDSPADGLIAISQRDPFLGCRVQYLDAGQEIEGLTSEEETRFVDPCHGSQYDLEGRYLAGPSEENLRRIPVEVVAGVAYIDPGPIGDS